MHTLADVRCLKEETFGVSDVSRIRRPATHHVVGGDGHDVVVVEAGGDLVDDDVVPVQGHLGGAP